MLTYDIDEGLTLEQAEEILSQSKLCALVLPSTSHTPEHHRFRVILPLARTITNADMYNQTWEKGAEIFGGVIDTQTRDLGRFYFGCRSDDGFWLEGDFFNPVTPKLEQSQSYTPSQTTMISVTDDLSQLVEQIYGEKREKIPEAVDFFLKNAHTGLQGKWTNSLNSFVFSLTLSGVDDSIIYQVCEELAPQKLDRKDEYQIKRSIRDGKAAL